MSYGSLISATEDLTPCSSISHDCYSKDCQPWLLHPGSLLHTLISKELLRDARGSMNPNRSTALHQ